MLRNIPRGLFVLGIFCVMGRATLRSEEEPLPIKGQGYELVYHDEFSGPKGAAPDPAFWSPRREGEKWRDAWNAEDACRQDGEGHLAITTRRNGDRVETGYIVSRGKVEATHGYFECRCRVQKAEGFWTAFWIQTPTMGKPLDDPAKAGVEIDVMEYLATKSPDLVQHTIHWNGYAKEHIRSTHVEKRIPGISEGFHTYAVKWDDAGYVFYTDGVETGRLPEAPVSRRPQHLILSCEVGPWAGDIQKAVLPDDFLVDYVRVWQTPAQRDADKQRSVEKALSR